MYEPTPGRATAECPTLIDSEATTKNQPPDMDNIMFQTSAGMANGTSSCQKRIHADRLKRLGRLGELRRYRTQRLVETERHVPGLAGENGENGRELRTEHAPGRQRQEEDACNRNETQNRHRLQDVQNRHQEPPGALALRRPSRVGQRENQREKQRRQHAESGSGGVFRQMHGIERERHDLELRQRCEQAARRSRRETRSGPITTMNANTSQRDASSRKKTYGSKRLIGAFSQDRR